MTLTNIHVRYCSRYNGVYLTTKTADDELELDEFPEHRAKHELVVDQICSYAYDQCDDDGYFEGDEEELEKFSIEAVKEVFGPDVTVTFEEDPYSS